MRSVIIGVSFTLSLQSGPEIGSGDDMLIIKCK
jgi:hypothetical protein